MSGKPAARQGDMTQYGGSIVQGSAGVRIGAPTGVACSVCPGGVTSGHPVNPLLGAKVLPGETDIALPGPLPFILSRTYSSYRTKTPAPVGSLGPGWKMPADIRLQLRDNTLILSDNGGRSLYFEHLFPGEDGYSRSESLWLVRGGVAKLDEGHRLAALWQALPEELRLSPHRYLATNSPQGPWWLLGWCERVPEADEVLPAPLPPYRVLTGLVDRFGRTQTFHREAAGEFSGEITGVTDGAWRHFRLVLTTQAQRAEEARQQAISGGTEPSAFPDTLPGYTEYGRDNGIRLSAVWLTHDPEYPENLPAAPLVRYGWTPRGELAAVYDRSNTQVRSFTYDDKYRGRMVAHRHTGRPEICYRYDSDGRVTEQLNPAGLSYTYQYEKDRITITDSLNRREVLHTQGEGGLKRVVKKEHADGSVTQSQFDAVGRLRAQTDAAGRTTEYSPDVVTGLITRITTPDGRASAFYYNHHSQLTSATGPDGLEIRREYDEWGRLIQETAPDGDITRYRYDNPHSDLPCATEDATGSRKTMTWSRYGQLLSFTDCSGYVTRYDHDRFGQVTAVHREEGLSQYRAYDSRGQLIAVKDTQGHETRYEYNAAGDLTTVIAPDGSRNGTQYDAWGKAICTTQGGLTRSMEYDAAGRVIRLTSENGSHTTFRYDVLDRLIQETDLIPEGVIRTDDERTHRYHYDSQHRLVHYTRTQYAEPLVESRYLYDPLGRRVAKRVWRRERDLTGWMSLSRKPQVTWYGWDGDRLTTIQNDRTRIQTIYQPGSFTPLIRVETATGELAKTQRRSLADTLQQSGGEDGGSVVFPPVLVQMLDRLESEILADRVSEESRRWLASCGLTVEQMQNQMDPVYTPARKIHLYHCDHRGLPLALVSTEGATEWCAEYDEWGNLLNEENPHQLQQLIRLPGQQYDEESGLYYNRHRYYDPLQGRYITQDPIGLKGGWNFYQYPLNPVQYIDSMGLASKYGHLNNGGYGARPNKPPTPDPSKLPDIAKQLRLPYPIDQASSAPNVFKTFFRALSPYDYTLYCRKWVKPNLTCTPQDDSQYPGMDTKTASDYLPQTNWPTTQLPPGYTCAEPYLFPDINKPDGPATAGIDDLGEILAKMKQRTSRGIRK
ncbi:TPA: RHS repeat protein [Escherichia coli]|uniref:RHS repeat-associated core domain-containing protein n=1 Tax=Escherichia coli TaxID=562 RepID=UPI000E0D62DD|nr:RHS repeat-associated core domain-containing protein [Escherichia coli]AXI36347.1 core protein [Escherichia coli]EFM5979810.1 RHS repeat protein [Escherichia coli]HBC1555034.1 RHS repeat protein [Escherichia coli]HCP5433619.1 RHS repeat protein [Escherichia coli]HCS7560179.1 RHS repeat protein [Escherichia coli]